MRLIIHATNIHQGGGKSLLASLLNALPLDLDIVAQLDSRMTIPDDLPSNLTIRYVKPSVVQRLLAEWWLSKNTKSDDLVLCFGSLPPFFKVQGKVMVLIQNRYLLEKARYAGFPFKTRLRLSIERAWLAITAAHADEFIVQTPSMKISLERAGFFRNKPLFIWPFASMHGDFVRTNGAKTFKNNDFLFDFFYVASGEPHKNHQRLIEAWNLLAEQGQFPTLCLTLDKKTSTDLCAWIDIQKNTYGLKINNVGFIPHDQVLQLYTQARSLIYPSLFESFGLPLIEARQAGLPVLASELDYVRDVLDPEQSFDPHSALSIARAVKRFLDIGEAELPLCDADMFIKAILQRRIYQCEY